MNTVNSISVSSTRHDASSKINLIRDIRTTLDIEIPEAIDTEIAIYRKLAIAKETRQHELRTAVQRMYDVDAAEFDAATDDVIDASLRGFAAQEVDTLIHDASYSRLNVRVFDEVPRWELAVVEKFNQCVADFRLNELAPNLPNFGDPKSFNVLSMSQSQGHAVDQWREASVHLHALWSLYRRLVGERGDTILGPAGVDDMSTNLLTACVLGNPGSMRVAMGAATAFASIAAGSDSVKAYGPFLPFVIAPVAGYELHLHTTRQANALRSRLQAAA